MVDNNSWYEYRIEMRNSDGELVDVFDVIHSAEDIPFHLGRFAQNSLKGWTTHVQKSLVTQGEWEDI